MGLFRGFDCYHNPILLKLKEDSMNGKRTVGVLTLLVIAITLSGCATTATAVLPAEGSEFKIEVVGKEGRAYVQFQGDNGLNEIPPDSPKDLVIYYDRTVEQGEYAILYRYADSSISSIDLHLLESKEPAE